MKQEKSGAPEGVYSDYSLHFRGADTDLYEQNKARLESRLEAMRLRLDLALIEKHAKGPKVLDFPIGTGRIYPHLLGHFEVSGYDICPPYVEQARKLNPQIAERFQINSFEELDRSRRFDTVISLRVLDAIKDLDPALANIARVLEPGGRWLFTLDVRPQDLPDFEARLGKVGLRLRALERYDIHATMRSMSPSSARLYGYWRAVIERGLVPFPLFKAVDRLFSARGIGFFVAERPTHEEFH